MMSMIPVALLLLMQSAQVIPLSEVDKREPGRIFVSWVGDPPPKFVETREAWFGLERTATYKCEDPRFSGATVLEDGHEGPAVSCADVFYEYRVIPGTETFWVELMRTQDGVFVASWTLRAQLAGQGAGTTDLRPDDDIVVAKEGIRAHAPGLMTSGPPKGVHAGRDEVCVNLGSGITSKERRSGDSENLVRTNRAGAELLGHGTIHDLLVRYVDDFFKSKGHSALVLNHPQRLVFEVDSIKGAVLGTVDKSLWEHLDIEMVFVEPIRTSRIAPIFTSDCIQIYFTIIGSYAAGTPNVPSVESFHSMAPKYSQEEQGYAGYFLGELSRYLSSAKDEHD